jgi:hypothetical protein
MEPVPAKFWRDLGLHYFLADCFGIVFFFQNNPPENNIEAVPAKFWQELGLQYFPADCFGFNFFFFLVVIFSGCNLNPPKNIAGQTIVPFFSGHNFFGS